MSRWVDAARGSTPDDTPVTPTVVEPSGPWRPQRGVTLTRSSELGQFQDPTGTPLWVLGAHGGAGEDTLSALLPGAAAAGRMWPVRPPGMPGATVLVVCRSNHHGLRAAQRAAVEYAAGTVLGVRLLGLVIVADVPGKRPKELRDLATVVAGGFPEAWEFPWIEDYRIGAAQPALPSRAAATIQTISDRLALINR